MFVLRSALVGWLALFFATAAAGQLQQARITATVWNAAGLPLADVIVLLSDALGAEVQRAVTDIHGRAVFDGVSPGRFELRAVARSGLLAHVPITVNGALPIEVAVRVPATLSERVVVEATMSPDTSSRSGLAGESLNLVPTRVRARGLQEVVATLPGWSTEDNGLLHARGVDDGFLYVIDGVPVYERLDAVHGIAPDLASLESVNVITGYISPEFGHKAGGVVEVRTAMAAERSGSVETSVGSERTKDVTGTIGGRVARGLAFRAGGSGLSSTRFLDPVHPDNLHNRGGHATTFGQMEWTIRDADRVSAGWGAGRARFEVPNNREQEHAGQDQRQRNGQVHFNTTWQRAWSARVVTQSAMYLRQSDSVLAGSPRDTPLEPHADRSLSRAGALFAATLQQGSHLFKGGLEVQRLTLNEAFRFHITDREEAEEAEFRDAALQFRPERPFIFSGGTTRGLQSFYLQDTWRPAGGLTFSGGMRFDRSTLLLTRHQWSPRLGVAVRLDDLTVLRGSVSRFFQPPQPENLLLSSSPEARVLSSIVVGDAEGGADIEPERQWGAEVGLERRVGLARFDVAFWMRRIRDAADPNVFAGTTIIFPNAIDKGRARGMDFRVEVPKRRSWSAYGSLSLSRVVQTGPVTGGLFLEDEVEAIGPGVEFSPDHDQRVTAGAGMTWEHTPSRFTIAFVGRYETGTPVQQDDDDLEELAAQPGAFMVNWDTGRVQPRTVVSLLLSAPVVASRHAAATVGVQVHNLLDAKYAFNFGNPFSGTHFGSPRSVAATLRVRFR